MSTATEPRSSVTGVVLAGGRGMRMHGCDKGLIEHGGCTLVERQLDALRPQVERLMISANRNLERYRAFGVEVVRDAQPDYRGPLAGMLAAARQARTDWIVCVPCDTLDLPADLATRLIDAALQAGTGAAYAEDAEGPQYVICALRSTLVGALADVVASPARAVRDFLHARRAAAVRFDGWRCANLNTPEALAC